ncbi:MAG: hypothetical protein ACXV2C_06395, partial [Candidatus Bathyarchaeia archaeon]
RVYLWKRYDAVQKIQEWMSEGIAPKVSMEIGNMTGHYSKEQGAYVIESFEFEAVAALGSNVTPCFPMAQIESYSNQTFEEAYYSMLQELKFSLQQIDSVVAEEAQKGGTDLSKELETQEAIVVEEKQEQEQSTFEAEQPSPQDTVEEVIEQPVATFSLTSEQMESELRRELAEIETLTEVYWDEVYTSPRYYYRDHKPEEKIVIAMDDKNWFLVGFSYSVIGDAVEIDASSIARYKVDYNPMDLSGDTDDDAEIDAVSDTEVDPETLKDEDDMFSAFTLKAKAEFMVEAKEKAMKKQFEAEKEAITSELNAKLAELQEQYSTLESKMISLDAEMAKKIEEERKQAEDALFESFSTSLTEDEMAPIKNKLGEMSLQDAEEKLFALVGKKAKVTSATFSKVVDEEVKPIRYSIVDDSVKSKSDKPWADLIQIKE